MHCVYDARRQRRTRTRAATASISTRTHQRAGDKRFVAGLRRGIVRRLTQNDLGVEESPRLFSLITILLPRRSPHARGPLRSLSSCSFWSFRTARAVPPLAAMALFLSCGVQSAQNQLRTLKVYLKLAPAVNEATRQSDRSRGIPHSVGADQVRCIHQTRVAVIGCEQKPQRFDAPTRVIASLCSAMLDPNGGQYVPCSVPADHAASLRP